MFLIVGYLWIDVDKPMEMYFQIVLKIFFPLIHSHNNSSFFLKIINI